MEKIRFRLTKRALEDHSIPPTEAVVINSFELGKQKSRDQKMELLKKVGLFTESDSVADNESESTQWSTHFSLNIGEYRTLSRTSTLQEYL